MLNHTKLKLGKLPVKRDRRTLQLSKYLLPAKLPPIPDSISFEAKIQDWGMMLNDQLGDCVIAAAGHMVQQWSTYATREFTPTDAQILRAYEAVGGYRPGQPDTDQGATMLDMLKYWRKVGLGGHKIGAFVQVKATNLDEIWRSIQLFGNCFLGLQLPLTSQCQDVCWIVTDPTRQTDVGTPGSWGGHAVALLAAHERAFTSITWGQLLHVTHNFVQCYADEAYAVLSKDWITAGGTAPPGFDYAMLQADLAQIAGK